MVVGGANGAAGAAVVRIHPEIHTIPCAVRQIARACIRTVPLIADLGRSAGVSAGAAMPGIVDGVHAGAGAELK